MELFGFLLTLIVVTELIIMLQDDLVDESPDSPDVPDDLPYVTLKR